MFIQSPTMSLIILVVGPIAIFGINELIKRVRGVARAQFISLTQVISDMQETAAGIRIVKAFNLEGIMRKRMAASIDDVRARADKIVQIGARTSPLMEVLGGFAIAMIVLWAGYQTIYFDVKPGALMSFIAAIALAYEPAKRLARMQITLEAGLVGVRLMYELLDTPPTIETNEDGPAPDRQQGRGRLRPRRFLLSDDGTASCSAASISPPPAARPPRWSAPPARARAR